MRDSSWVGIQEMYEKGEISQEQMDTFLTIRNLTDEEWSQVKNDYLQGTISKDEFEQMKKIRDMPDDWRTLENGVKGIFYGVGTGVWEGVQYYVGGKLAGWTLRGGSKLATSAVRVGVDTGFNALDTPYRSLLSTISTETTFEEAWESQGGWTSVLTSAGVGLIGSVGGEVFDGIKSRKGTTTNATDTMKKRMDKAKKKMSKYFKKNPDLDVSNEDLEKSFAKIIACNSDEEFINIARKLTTWNDDELACISAFRSSHNGGTIVLRPNNSVETIIHEVNHDLGDVLITPGGVIKMDVDPRGINEAFTESLALKIAGIDGVGVSGYASNVAHLNRMVDILENAGYINIEAKTYYTSSSAYLGVTVNQIMEDNDFYNEIVNYMNIADGWGGITDPIAIKQANIYIESLIDTLEKKVGG